MTCAEQAEAKAKEELSRCNRDTYLSRIKRTSSLIIVFLTINPCEKHAQITYEQGLAICDSLLKQRQEESGTEFVFIGRDCIVGAVAPQFTTSTIDGNVVDKEYFKGKVSVVNFWFITCPPCVAEIPVFNDMVGKFGTEDVNFLAIGRDRKDDVDEFLIEHPWQFDHIANGRTLIEETFRMRWGYPTTFILDKNATIVAVLH